MAALNRIIPATFPYRALLKNRPLQLLLLALLAYAVVAFRSAWLAEDAFITFRTVDNWVSGYGLRWNVGERVQAYTHPLWMLAISPFYALTGEIFYTAIFFSLAVSLAAALVLALRLSASPRAAILGIVLLTGSKAFVDYSTSGLENPLTHLLLALFLALYLRRDTAAPRTRFGLSLIAALATVNRMDALLLFLPALIYLLWRKRSVRALATLLAGFAPFLLWELFSLVYYGSLVPNTAYAKLNTGIPVGELAMQGLHYLHNSLSLDPLTLSVVTLGLLVPLAKKERRLLPLSVGMLLYLAYVVRIGGDFMSGRFLTPPFFAAVALIVHSQPFASPRIWSLTLGAALLAGLLPSRSPLRSGADYGSRIDPPTTARNISDERALYYRHAGLLPSLYRGSAEEYPDHWWAIRGRQLRRSGELSGSSSEGYLIAPAHGGRTIATWSNVGYSGFYAGPRVHILDALALAEPLLARLPARAEEKFGPGHFFRIVPEGYIETLISDRNAIADADLATYYDALCLITRGDLFTSQRWRALWKLHAGHYDHLIDWARYRHPSPLERLRSEIRTRPNDPSKHLLLGQELLALGRVEEGLRAFEKTFELNPRSLNNFLIVGDLCHHHQLLEAALSAYAKAARIEPERVEPRVSRGDVLLALNRPDEAEQAYGEAIRRAPDDPLLFHKLGTAQIVLGQRSAARQSFQQAVALKSAKIESHLFLVSLLKEADRPAEALAVCEDAIRIFAGMQDTASGAELSRLWVELSRLRHQAGDAAGAIAALENALALEENNAGDHFTLGSLYYSTGQYDSAVRSLRRAAQLHPQQPRFHSYLGTTLRQLGQLPAAEQAYREAARLEPSEPRYHQNLGAVQLQQHKDREALASLQRAIRAGARDIQIHLAAADLFRQFDQPEDARRIYRQLLARAAPELDAGTRAGIEIFLNSADSTTSP